MYRPKAPGRVVTKRTRPKEELRSLDVRIRAVPQADGSAYLELGRTKVVASVFRRDRNDDSEGSLVVDVSAAPYLEPLDPSMASQLHTALEAVLMEEEGTEVLELFVHVVDDDGCVLAAALDCSSVALADASIPMVDIVIASTVCKGAGGLALDCEKGEEASATVIVATLPARNRVAYFNLCGHVSAEELEQMIQLCRDANEITAETVRQFLKSAIQQEK